MCLRRLPGRRGPLAGMTTLLWFITRSSGVVALVLMLIAVADGLLFSGRATGQRLRPAWWLDLHRGLGGYALAFTGLHLAAAFGADIGVGLTEIFVPGAAAWSTGAFTWGVIATYLMALTVLTTWPRRRLRRRAWHTIHVLSIPAAAMAVVHAVQLGTDAMTPWFTGVLVVAVAIASYPLALRLIGVAPHAPTESAPTVQTSSAGRTISLPTTAHQAAPAAADRRHDRDEVPV